MARKLSVFRHGEGFRLISEGDLHDARPTYLHGAKYGIGGFTGQRIERHRDGPYAGERVMFRLEDHLARLLRTMQAHEWMTSPVGLDEIRQAMFRLMATNIDDDYFSFVFSSGGDVGVMPKGDPEHLLFINSRDFNPETHPYLAPEALHGGLTVRLTEPDLRRGYPSKLNLAKVSGNYALGNVAKFRAMQHGADDALLLDWRGGNISELSVANVLVLFGDTLVSPNRDSGALDGITKQTLQTMAHELYSCQTAEAFIPITSLKRARMMIACGTAIGACRITRVIGSTGSIIWEQPEKDVEAKQLAQDLTDGIWRALRGQLGADFHPEWYTPIPEHHLRDQQLALQLA